MTSKATLSASVGDKHTYFVESATEKIGATKASTSASTVRASPLPSVTSASSTIGGDTTNGAQPYQQSTNKVVVKRYAIKRD